MKQEFVRQLAQYLVGDQTMMSIKLQMGDALAERWASLRQTTPLMGYPTVEEATHILGQWLGIEGV